MAYVRQAERDPQLLLLKRSDWQPATAAAPKLSSKARVLSARVSLGGANGVEAALLDLFAVDRTDDGKDDYDGLVAAAAGKAAGRGPAGPRGPADRATLLARDERGHGQRAR